MSKSLQDNEKGEQVAGNRVAGLPDLLGRDLIKVQQNSIRERMINVHGDIHMNAIQCYMHAKQFGDTSLMLRLLTFAVEPETGYRRQALIAHMRRFTPMTLSGKVIKLGGVLNGQPIPWDIETALVTPFTDIPEFGEGMVALKPVFKDGPVGRLAAAVKAYKDAVTNSKIENGHVVGPVDPKKPFYNGIHLDKMDDIFDAIETKLEEFQQFSDDTATVWNADKVIAEARSFKAAAIAMVKTQAEEPVEEPAKG